MNPQEKSLLEGFLAQLVEVPGIRKDRAAAALIEGAFERQPNAAYLVVQRALLLQQALADAEAEIARLKAERRDDAPASPGASFLDPAAWGRGAAPGAAGVVSAAANPPARTGAARGASGAGFLGQAAAVAAGVAGGAFLFQGINRLLGGDAAEQAAAGTPAAAADVAPADGAWSEAAGDLGAEFDGGDFLA